MRLCDFYQVDGAGYERQAVADHANNLATRIRGNLTNSMKALGVEILTGVGTIVVRKKNTLLFIYILDRGCVQTAEFSLEPPKKAQTCVLS